MLQVLCCASDRPWKSGWQVREDGCTRWHAALPRCLHVPSWRNTNSCNSLEMLRASRVWGCSTQIFHQCTLSLGECVVLIVLVRYELYHAGQFILRNHCQSGCISKRVITLKASHPSFIVVSSSLAEGEQGQKILYDPGAKGGCVRTTHHDS